MLAASTVAKMALLITERLVDRLANPDNENFVP
jgi:hypothetical protein